MRNHTFTFTRAHGAPNLFPVAKLGDHAANAFNDIGDSGTGTQLDDANHAAATTDA